MTNLERVLIDAISSEDHLYSDGKTVFNPPTCLLRALDAALEYWVLRHEAMMPDVCTWTQMVDWDNSEGWDASCGAAWSFDWHPIKDHEYKFCPNCGKSIVCVEAKPAEGENSE